METIIIRWTTGSMEINLNEFFPTSIARVRKLREIIPMDPNHETVRAEIANYIEGVVQMFVENVIEPLNDDLRNLTLRGVIKGKEYRRTKAELTKSKRTLQNLQKSLEVIWS